VGTPSSQLPPPAGGPSPTSTWIAGQQTEPSTVVPHTPGLVGASTQTNSLALVSLVTGILSFLGHVIPFIGGSTLAVVAIITGYMARNQIKETGEQGMGLATAGMVLGIVNLAVVVLIVIFFIFLIFVVGITIFGLSAHRG
jgi:hypothetical protein